MLSSRRTQMDSLVQPLVAQYLAMGCQSKENQSECVATEEKGKDDVRVTGCTSGKSKVSPPGRNHRFHKFSPVQTPPGKSGMSLGHLAKGATWEELIQACLQCFDTDGDLRGSSHLLNVTLTMHRLLMSSSDLLDKLVCLHWIQEFWGMFRLHHSLSDKLDEFRDLIREQGQEHLCSLLETKWINERDWSWKASQKIKANYSKKRKVSLLFDHLEPSELADHLTYLEFKSFCRISFLDFQNYMQSCCMKDIPVLERSIALCNGMSQWVQLMVLSRPTAQLRAEVFTKFLHVAQSLHQMHNYNTLMAVVGGLCHSSISRLKDTTSHVPSEVTKVLNEMTDLLSSCRNYDNYRHAYSRCSGFKIPILGVHLKDLITVNEAMSDYVEDNKVNIHKLQVLYNHINELIQLQQIPPRLDANKDLVHLLTLSLDLYYSEDEIYELSYAREPKNCKAPPSTPSKPPVCVDWASGVAPKPDPRTISKHVQRMVDSVFKNYDHDENGFISHDDFEKIAASFPFSFCVMDKEKEGMVSREEITAYFMRASVICSKLGLGFVHNFQEATYMKPTFCDNCSGFLWGVIKQGYRCKDCGMNCHKLCKDQVAFECKKNIKVSNTTDSPPLSTTPVATGNSEGSEECPFPYPPDDSKDYSHSSQFAPRKRPVRVHSYTQTEGSQLSCPTVEAVEATQLQSSLAVPPLSSPTAESSNPQPSILTAVPHTLPLSPNSVLQRKTRYCAKWENKASVLAKNCKSGDESKGTHESLELENQSLKKDNETLRRKLREAEREMELLKTLLKNHALHPLVVEDSS